MSETPESPSVEQIARHIKAMGDSVTVINEEIAKGFNEKVGRRVKANVDHLSLMLTKDFVIADGGSKTAFTAAVAAGQAYLDDNK
jgi:predicted glycosyltransferase